MNYLKLLSVALYVLTILIQEGISWRVNPTVYRIDKGRSWRFPSLHSGLSIDDYRQSVLQFNQELSSHSNELNIEDESFDRELAQTFFADLAKGGNTITVKEFLQWEELQDFVDMGVTTKPEILNMLKNVGVNAVSVNGNESVNFEQFYGALREVNELFMASDLAVEAEKDLDFQRFMNELSSNEQNDSDDNLSEG